MMKKGEKKELDSLMGNMLNMIISGIRGNNDMGIVEFANEIVFNGDPSFQLYPQQKIVLKCFYGEDLTEEEQAILDIWSKDVGSVGLPRSNFKKNRRYLSLVLEAGRRGSKSTIASIIALKEFYDLITLENPAKTYELLPNDPIAIFIIAQTQAQAKEAIFSKVVGYCKNSYYFQGLEKTGVIEILTEEIRCRAKNIGIYAKHTNSKALVGYNLKCLVLDEVARFETNGDTGVNTADLIWKNVSKGLTAFNRKADLSCGRAVAISSAWEKGDSIQRFQEEGFKDPSSLVLNLTTFQLNPTLNSTSPSVVSDYIKDPETARLEYEGIRKERSNTFLSSIALKNSLRGSSDIDYHLIDIDIGEEDIRHYVGCKITRVDPTATRKCFIHVDLGLKKDSASLCLSTLVNKEGKLLVESLAVMEWEPYVDARGKKRLVYFENIENTVLLLSNHFNIQKVTFDSWGSPSLIQSLHKKGISTEEVSSSREKQVIYYKVLEKLLGQSMVILPADNIGGIKGCAQLSALVMKTDGSIVHPYLKKDIADVICISVYQTYMNAIQTGLLSGIEAKVSVARPPKAQNKGKQNRLTTLKIGSAIHRIKNKKAPFKR